MVRGQRGDIPNIQSRRHGEWRAGPSRFVWRNQRRAGGSGMVSQPSHARRPGTGDVLRRRPQRTLPNFREGGYGRGSFGPDPAAPSSIYKKGSHQPGTGQAKYRRCLHQELEPSRVAGESSRTTCSLFSTTMRYTGRTGNGATREARPCCK